MSEIGKRETDYIGYEYKDKTVPYELSSLYRDSYPCFGWEEDPNELLRSDSGKKPETVLLRFRRNRKICNKAELTRLQRNFDGCVAEIEALKRSETAMPSVWALIIGVIGTAFMAGSVFAVTAEPPRLVLMVLFAIPGFLGWLLPFFVYRALVHRQTARLEPLIEDKYDEIYEICEKGSRLLI